MLVLVGNREIRTKTMVSKELICEECNNKTLEISIYDQCFHLFFIPVIPTGPRRFKTRCMNCGYVVENSTRSFPASLRRRSLYLYSISLIFALFLISIIPMNLLYQKQKAEYIEMPRIDDVYRISVIENGNTSYSFLKIMSIEGSEIGLLHNNYEYFRFPIEMDKSDYFDSIDVIYVQKSEIERLLKEGVINSVERNYREDSQFNINK